MNGPGELRIADCGLRFARRLAVRRPSTYGPEQIAIRHPQSRRPAFTLLEVVLTLMIATLLIAAIGSALNFHLRLTERGRSEVEQAQLARALLHRIADDLRSAVPVAVETSGTTATDASGSSGTASSGTSSSGASSGSGSTSAGGGSSGGQASSSGSSTSGGIGTATSITALKTQSAQSATSSAGSTGTNSANGASAEEPADDETASPPGIYGTQTELTVDVARSRPAAAVDPLQMLAPAGDVQSVAYYLASTSGVSVGADGANLAVASGGLFRREVDRAAALQSATTGGLDAAQYERLLASEVTSLTFRYFDGTEWLTEWDSSTRSALPVCVEVVLALRSAAAPTSANPLALFDAAGETTKTYRLLVHVPIAAPSTSADAATDAAPSTETETP